jgi:SPP1 gp7 family putative phage head morphogenesis protein
LNSRDRELDPLAKKMENAFQVHFDKLQKKIFRNIDNAHKAYRVMNKQVDEDIFVLYFPPEAAELEQFNILLVPIIWEIYRRGWDMASGTLKDPVEWKGETNPTLLAVAEEQKNLITGMSEDVYKELKERINQSFVLGWTVKQTKDEIAKVFGLGGTRARRIARTETMRGLNASSFAMYGESMEVAGFEWSAVMDGKTRPAHQMMNGERIMKGDIFSNGLQYPLDPLGPADEVVNCRCVALPLTENDMDLET